jgi:hypothetical protein
MSPIPTTYSTEDSPHLVEAEKCWKVEGEEAVVRVWGYFFGPAPVDHHPPDFGQPARECAG